MFVDELAELVLPPFPPPPLPAVLLSRTAVFGTSCMTPSPRASEGMSATMNNAHTASAMRLPNDLDMCPSPRVDWPLALGARASGLMQIAKEFATTNSRTLPQRIYVSPS